MKLYIKITASESFCNRVNEAWLILVNLDHAVFPVAAEVIQLAKDNDGELPHLHHWVYPHLLDHHLLRCYDCQGQRQTGAYGDGDWLLSAVSPGPWGKQERSWLQPNCSVLHQQGPHLFCSPHELFTCMQPNPAQTRVSQHYSGYKRKPEHFLVLKSESCL